MNRRHPTGFATMLGIAWLAWLGGHVVPSSVCAQGEVRSSRERTRITLRATIDPRAHRVVGTVDYDFVNTASVPVADAVFHRYLEAFRNDESVFMHESRGQLRGIEVEGTAGTELRSVVVSGQQRVATLERELVPGDFTQFRVRLPSPVAPGAHVTIRVEFVSRLPRLAVRAGYVRDFTLLAQWFPKLAKLDDDGSWASYPYHGNGEFYADFADYDVTLVAPAAYSVEGTGVRTSRVAARGNTTHHFVAPRVHDAAFAVALDTHVVTGRCHGVDVRVSYPRAYAQAAREHLAATCFGLHYFGHRLGRYPYASLAVIVPPEGADGGAGMEYPMAFVTDGPWYASRWLPFSSALETTFHELGHQWFQGLVATNEVEYPVLDEGLTNFIGYEALSAYLNRSDATFVDYWRTYVMGPNELPPGLPAYGYRPDEYGASVYGRSVLILESIARTYGRNEVWSALGSYARRGRWRHPTPADLVRAFDAEFQGRDTSFGSRVFAPLLLAGQRIRVHAARGLRGELVASRSGPLDVPIDVEVRVGDRVRREVWRGTRVFHARATRDRTACLVVDPDRKLLLDPDTRDDTICVDVRPTPTARLMRAVIAMVLRGGAP